MSSIPMKLKYEKLSYIIHRVKTRSHLPANMSYSRMHKLRKMFLRTKRNDFVNTLKGKEIKRSYVLVSYPVPAAFEEFCLHLHRIMFKKSLKVTKQRIIVQYSHKLPTGFKSSKFNAPRQSWLSIVEWIAIKKGMRT